MLFIDLFAACYLAEKKIKFSAKNTGLLFFFPQQLMLVKLWKNPLYITSALIFKKKDFFMGSIIEIFEIAKSTYTDISTFYCKIATAGKFLITFKC